MPSKLRKALGAVKDQTSISLAKVTNAANLEVIILKATTHEEIPIEERYVHEIVQLVSSNKVYAAACAQSIGKRIGKTRSWVVVLKSLMLVLRIFQDGDPYFPREVSHAMKRSAKILNLSGFRNDSSSSPWDYTAFVRTFALYLDERLDCFLTGKLQRRMSLKHQIPFQKNKRILNLNETGLKDMKPSILLDRITYWQRLLDRAMGTKPTGSAKMNHLVQITLYAVVQETFDLYRDISDGLAVILDSFFSLPCKACISAFQACMKSCKQFDELRDFYSFCLSIGVGRTNEYPTVQKVSQELMEALQEFLKDQATNDKNNSNNNFPPSSPHSPLSKHLLVSALRHSVGGSYKSAHDEGLGYERYGTPERFYEAASSEHGSSQCTSLEDLMSATDIGITTPRRSVETDSNDDNDISSAYESCSNHSNPIDQAAWSSMDLLSLDDMHNEGEKENHRNHAKLLGSHNASKDCWELVLVETTTTTTPQKTSTYNLINELDLFDQPSMPQNHHHNPFLEDTANVAIPTSTTNQNQANFIDLFDGEPPFLATPTMATVMTPTFRANQDQGEATMAPTFTAKKSSSETDLALIFGDLSITPPTFRSQQFAENNMALVPASQAKTLDVMTTAPNFYSQGSFKSSSAPTFNSQGLYKITSPSTLQGHNSYQTSTARTLDSQGSFKIGSPSTFQGPNSYQASTIPTLSSQDLFNISSISTFQSPNSYQTNTVPTSNSQGSFNIASTSTFQGHNPYQTSTASTFNSRGSFRFGSAPTFQGYNSYQTNTATTFNSQDSFKINSAPTLQDHNSYQPSTTPTFYGHNSYQTSTSPTSQGHNSSLTSTAPIHHSYNANQTSLEPASHSQNSYQTSRESNFQGNHSYQTSTEPTLQSHNLLQTSTTPTVYGCNSYQTSNGSTFLGYSSYQISTSPTFHAYNSYQTSTTPNFHNRDSYQASEGPKFEAHNSYMTRTTPTSIFGSLQNEATPTLAAKNPNEAMVPSTFWGQNLYDTVATPTFCARVSTETMVGAPKEDDLFGPSPSTLTSNEHALNKSKQEQSLVQQQQMWLEQQNKIIAKHMT